MKNKLLSVPKFLSLKKRWIKLWNLEEKKFTAFSFFKLGTSFHLNRFEAFAQRLVEGSFHKLFGEQSLLERLGQPLAEAIEAHQIEDRLPSHITIFLSTADLNNALEAGLSHAELEVEFQEAIRDLSQSLHLDRPRVFKVLLVEDSHLSNGMVRVESKDAPEKEQITQIQERPLNNQAELEAIKRLDAFLIVTGEKHITLEKPLVTLGRSLDNDVILDDATISRKHAQIRWRFGRFVLYDLSKKGRTVVNGVKVSEHALEPGDVIALSQVMIIYVEERTRPQAVKKQAHLNSKTRPLPKLDK